MTAVPQGSGGRAGVLPVVSVVGLAFVARLVAGLVHGGGGPGGVFGYDAGVYYAASDSLLQGRLPYRDFVLLHPPVLPLALTPFAALGRVTSDHTGYLVANLAFLVLASVNAGLVYGVARRLGADRFAAWLGGAFYAVWFGAVLAEVSLRLEPLAAFLALLAGFVLAKPERGRRAVFAAGALLGLAAGVKVWWALPLVVVLAVMIKVDRRTVIAYLAGVATAMAVVVLPFFAAAPATMWRMVVLDQLGRPDGGTLGLNRLAAIVSLRSAHVTGTAAVAGLVLAGIALATLLVRSVRSAAGRVVALLFLLQVATLILSPTYFSFYGGFLAPAAGVLVAMGAVGTRRRARLPSLLTVVVVGALCVASFVSTRPLSVPFPRVALTDAVAEAHCVGADSPAALIQLNVLTRNLRNGCPNWVDVTGHAYDTDASRAGIPRRRNPQWQADILRYLHGNDVALVIRPGTELSPQSRRTFRTWPVLRSADGVVIRVVPRARR